MSVARNRLLSAFGVAHRLAVTDYAQVTAMTGVRRACSHQEVKNTAYRRTLDYNVRMIHSITQPTWATSMGKDESRELMAVWPDVVRDITESNKQLIDLPELTKWLTKVLQYNVPGGKKTRALSVVHAFKTVASKDQLTDENIRLARILAWCVEMVHTSLLMQDDIMDRATVRRNQPCWYRYNDLGLTAINDSIMVEHALYLLLEKYFKQKDCYVNLLELFHNITMVTLMGQALDLQPFISGKTLNLDLFTMDRYNSIVNYKTSYYTFVLPVTIAMHFAGIKDREMFRQAKTILLEMGHFYQVQDDYIDCYSKVIDKSNTDIAEGKCTWLVVVALQRVTPQQRKILEECYGHADAEKIQRVKQLYNDLGLPNMYSIYEEETYNLLNTHIQQISRGLPHQLFLKILEKLYRRVS